ncbi:Sodium channel protein type 11 subunit alpha [Symbiodinium microadriaticum]|uniref:Sodium channel protein type 11 subunit alpha n=1 Tax=Symbiodinium microadriaticum TaxID=2951 RepID=A0A1Q9DCI5_SYMMI|nr:Sodium channel protein type 11 subunit alpha [Symbiodinium microadriaticum]
MKSPNRNRSLVNRDAECLTLGVYSHGAFYGTTNASVKHPQLTAYLNAFGKKHLPRQAQWTSLTISRNNQMPVHRDVNNSGHHPNYLVGLGSYQGGELWTHNPQLSEQSQNALAQVHPDGRRLLGEARATQHRVVQFDPKEWHATCPWTGQRIVITYFVSRGWKQLENEALTQVLEQGFQVPRIEEAHVIQKSGVWKHKFKNEGEKSDEKIKRYLSQAVVDFCDRNHIFLDVIPGEAHWQIGACEQAVQGLKEVMSKTCQEDPETSPEELLSVAVRTFNQRDMVRGFSPLQHAFGRSVDVTGRLVNASNGTPDELQIESAEGEFARNLARQAQAEKAHCDWQARQRLLRAQNSRGRWKLEFHPGQLVYFWRSQESGRGKHAPGTKKGRFLGPARVLATETRRSDSGELRPGSSVWLVRGRQLIKCAPEQLRLASQREELIEALAEDTKVPWTYTKVAQEIGGNQFEDATRELPDYDEWLRAQDPEQEEQPTRRRITRKRPIIEEGVDEEMEGAPAPRPGAIPRTREALSTDTTEIGHCWWHDVAAHSWGDKGEWWQSTDAAVEVQVELPESSRGFKKAMVNMSGFFVGALKKRAVEVCERRLSEQEKQEFRQAKLSEVKNFIAAEAFEALPEQLKPDRNTAINMRWVLTWKQLDTGGRKAKARAVLLGYQDPAYEHRATTSPVMSRQTRQCFLQMCANKKWRVYKGDVSGAFLQGRPYAGGLLCIPCDEICEAMGLAKGSVTRLKKACYGLVDAPLEWYKTVSEFLQTLGLERAWSDPCLWLWRPQGVLRGLVSGHVDDFLFGGSEEDSLWQEILNKIKQKFKWGDWEHGEFTQCGVQVRQMDQGFELSQTQYVEDHLQEIPLSGTRRRDKEAATTEKEKTQLRATLGALSWHAQQVAPHVAAETSLLLSEVSRSCVNTIIKTNLLVSHTRAKKHHVMKIHAFDPQEELCIYAWVDAGSQNRPDGGSTQGCFIGMSTMGLQRGEVLPVSPLSWSSSKIDRACRSPGAAETQAAVNGEDSLFYLRYQWSEIAYGQVQVHNPAGAVRRTKGCLISDSRNVFDKVNTEVLTIKGAEKRANIELLAIKAAQQETALEVRWVHSEAQLSNSLTKVNEKAKFKKSKWLKHCHWKWKFVCSYNIRGGAQYRGFELADDLNLSTNGRATWLGVQDIFTVLELAFGITFTVEVALRLFAEGSSFFKEAWNWLDGMVIIVWLLEKLVTNLPVNSQILRLARLFRLLRLLRLVRRIQEFDALFLMTTAIRSSVTVLGWTMALLFICQLLFALVVQQILFGFYFDPNAANQEAQLRVYEYFGTFTRSLLSLFELTLANWPPVCRLLVEEVSEWWLLMCLLHKLTMGFAVIGVINAVLMQETFKVAYLDDTVMVREKMRTMRAHVAKMSELFHEADTSGDGKLDFEEFKQILKKHEVKVWLSAMELDVSNVKELFTLVQGVSRLRGSGRAQDVRKILEMSEQMKHDLHELHVATGIRRYHTAHTGSGDFADSLAENKQVVTVNC